MALPAPAEHAARVARLYRHSLKNILSWAVNRQLFWEEVGTWRVCLKRGGSGWGGGARGRAKKGDRGPFFFLSSRRPPRMLTANNLPHTQAEKLRSEFERNRNVSVFFWGESGGREAREEHEKTTPPPTLLHTLRHWPVGVLTE